MSRTSRKFIDNKKPYRIVDILKGDIERWPNLKEKVRYAEPTGKGNLLVLDGFLGRMFRSDEGCVRDEINEFIRKYNEICMRLDEDPAHMCFDTMSWNDLYMLHGLVPSIAGDTFGYTNLEDYRVGLKFDIYMVEDGQSIMGNLGEPYLYYEPCSFCQPEMCYREV